MHTFIYIIAILQDIIIIKQTHHTVSVWIVIKCDLFINYCFSQCFYLFIYFFTLTKHYTFKLRRKNRVNLSLLNIFIKYKKLPIFQPKIRWT